MELHLPPGAAQLAGLAAARFTKALPSQLKPFTQKSLVQLAYGLASQAFSSIFTAPPDAHKPAAEPFHTAPSAPVPSEPAPAKSNGLAHMPGSWPGTAPPSPAKQSPPDLAAPRPQHVADLQGFLEKFDRLAEPAAEKPALAELDLPNPWADEPSRSNAAPAKQLRFATPDPEAAPVTHTPPAASDKPLKGILKNATPPRSETPPPRLDKGKAKAEPEPEGPAEAEPASPIEAPEPHFGSAPLQLSDEERYADWRANADLGKAGPSTWRRGSEPEATAAQPPAVPLRPPAGNATAEQLGNHFAGLLIKPGDRGFHTLVDPSSGRSIARLRSIGDTGRFELQTVSVRGNWRSFGITNPAKLTLPQASEILAKQGLIAQEASLPADGLNRRTQQSLQDSARRPASEPPSTLPEPPMQPLRRPQSLPDMSELARLQAAAANPNALGPAQTALGQAAQALTLAASLPNVDRKQLDALQAGAEHLRRNLADPARLKDPSYLASAKTLATGLADAARHLAKTTPISVPIAGGEAKLYGADIPGFFDMSAPQRQQTVQLLGEKIRAGQALYQRVASARSSFDETWLPAPSRETVSNLAWFLKSKASEAAGSPYEKGALTLPDPDNRLRRYLDRVQTGEGEPEVYLRRSSHLPDQQRGNFPPGTSPEAKLSYLREHQPRGCDFYEGTAHEGAAIGDPRLLLPSGMRTLLYQQVRTPAGEPRLYVKMETESARADPMTPSYDGQIKSRPVRPEDAARTAAHAGNLLKKMALGGQATQKDLPQLREEVPKPVLKMLGAVLEQARRSDPAAYQLLSRGTPHLGQIAANIAALTARPRPPEPALQPKLAALQAALAAVPLRGSPDLGSRFGEEVVLTAEDLRPAAPQSRL